MFTSLAISNCLNVNPITPSNPWNVVKVHSPPILIQVVNDPWTSGPHSNSSECPMQLEGVDTDAVMKLHPSRYDVASP